MANLEITTRQENEYPKFHKKIELSEGQALKDDADLLAFASKSVPSGKTVKVIVNIVVISIE
jgi:hypothetical protein